MPTQASPIQIGKDEESFNWKALLYMFLCTSSFTVMNSIVKYMEALPALELVFFRAITSCIICVAILRIRGIPILGNNKKILIARALFGVASMATFFLAFKVMPFGSTVSLRYVAPIFAAIMAVFYLKEQIRPLQWFFFALAFAGVVLLKGFDLRISSLGLTYVIISAFFSGVVYVIIRKIGQSEHPLVIVNYFMFIASLTGLIFSWHIWIWPQGQEWLILSSIGIFGFFGQFFMTKAFQIEKTSKVAPMKYMEAIFALLVGWLWLGETYSAWAFVGIVLILAGMLLNVFFKGKKA
ncbi:MAG: DMT family transporter [Bacteroidota bacterium]